MSIDSYKFHCGTWHNFSKWLYYNLYKLKKSTQSCFSQNSWSEIKIGTGMTNNPLLLTFLVVADYFHSPKTLFFTFLFLLFVELFIPCSEKERKGEKNIWFMLLEWYHQMTIQQIQTNIFHVRSNASHLNEKEQFLIW